VFAEVTQLTAHPRAVKFIKGRRRQKGKKKRKRERKKSNTQTLKDWVFLNKCTMKGYAVIKEVANTLQHS